MATEHDPSEGDTRHEDHEWEAQRPNFTKYYMEQNKTLKEATQCMIDHHGFYATPRQWERKIGLWDLTKYTNRKTRLDALAASGKSLFEVANASRRPRVHSDSSGMLLPDGTFDRNFRRFVKREASRSRSRSRSNSFGRRTRSRSATPVPDANSSSEIINDTMLDMDFSSLADGDIPPTVPLRPTDHEADSPQIHVFQTLNRGTGETNREVILALPEQQFQAEEPFVAGNYPTTFGFNNVGPQFDGNNITQTGSMMDQSMPYQNLDVAFASQPDITRNSQDFMSTVSPPFNQPQFSGWGSQPIFSGPDTAEMSMMTAQSFHQISTDDASPRDFHPAMGEYASAMPVPELRLERGDGGFDEPQPEMLRRQQTFDDLVSMNDPLYADFYGSVSRYSQAVLERVMTNVTSTSDPGQLQRKVQNDLNSECAVFVQNLTTTLNNFANSQQRAVEAIRDKCRLLKMKNSSLEQQLAHNQIASQNQSSVRAGSGHRFSVPTLYGHHGDESTPFNIT